LRDIHDFVSFVHNQRSSAVWVDAKKPLTEIVGLPQKLPCDYSMRADLCYVPAAGARFPVVRYDDHKFVAVNLLWSRQARLVIGNCVREV